MTGGLAYVENSFMPAEVRRLSAQKMSGVSVHIAMLYTPIAGWRLDLRLRFLFSERAVCTYSEESENHVKL